jgi:hypothetical protein
MNEVLHEAEVLNTIKNAVETGVPKDKIVELLQAIIDKKLFEVASFELQYAEEIESA